MRYIVKIALPLPVKRLFDYVLPEELYANDLVGRRALVPLGKRTVTGIVVEVTDKSDNKKLKEVYELLDEEPVFMPNLLELTKWIAEYYLTSWGITLNAALPQGMSPKSLLKVEIVKHLSGIELHKLEKKSPRRAELYKKLLETFEPISVSTLENSMDAKSIMPQVNALEKMGVISVVKIIESSAKPKMQKAVRVTDEIFNHKTKLKEILDELDAKAPKQSLMLSHLYLLRMNSSIPALVADALKQLSCSQPTISSLEKKGFVEIYDVEIDRSKEILLGENLSTRNEAELELTAEQENVLSKVIDAVEQQSTKPYLLHGVTGSGKTLIYIHAIEKAIEIGKTALILVPEISLTPQLIDRFERVFPGQIAVLHSRMSEGQRYDSWRAILNRKVKIVLGARSAIFAPLSDIGIIIVDEEHEHTYKQDSPAPRYNARDAAVIRAKIENCCILLGSATPSLESMNNANNGKYSLLNISQRADGALLPRIRIIDTLNARKSGQMEGPFSRQLINEIIIRMEKKEGVILMQNRRGFSVLLECPDCGNVPMCRDCDVALTYHKASDQLRCHYCGWTVRAYKECPECGYPKLHELGTGTQKIESNLEEILIREGYEPKILRMDFDTTRKKGSHRKILHSFASGETDILIGTQMVAKGLDISRVTLVGVINADIQLFMPDFRASERTFQLLTQVSGRAGRSGSKPGEVIIQTSHPHSSAITAVLQTSYDMFYNNEINHRRSAKYPPFTRFVLIEFSGTNEELVDEHSKIFSAYLPQSHEVVEVLGPVQPNIPKLRKYFRRQIIVKSSKKKDPSGKILRHILNSVMDAYSKDHFTEKVRVVIDVDSYSGS
jgi:primosomal protein N' (replication factor Y)